MINFIRSNKVYLVYLLLAIYWIILFIATSIPSEYVPSIGVADKFSHLFAYLGLSVLMYFTFAFQKKYLILKKYPGFFSLIIGSLYGIFDELHQMLIPGRSAELLDWIADFVGVIIGILIVKIIFMKYNSKIDIAEGKT
ncbi:MAG: VanZ family protein [Ignavibacteriaceae bacterium]|nr:VanZ family protein [Ignavibacteriaceae bacterium]